MLSPSSPAVRLVVSCVCGPPWLGAVPCLPLGNTFSHSRTCFWFLVVCCWKMSIFTLYCSFSRATLLEETRTRWLHNRIVAMVTYPTGMSDVHLIAPYTLSNRDKNGWKHKLSSVAPTQIIFLDITHCSNRCSQLCHERFYQNLHLLYEVVKAAQWMRWIQRKGEKFWRKGERWYCLCYVALSAAYLSTGFHTCMSCCGQG